MPLSAGQMLRGRYRIEALLGQGGMGAVYQAHDSNLGITVVVKENLIHSEEARRQFGREASILASLRHPNLPRVTDFFFIADQGQYLVMDYVAGKDLRQIIAERGPFPEPQALSWIYPVLDALEYLHQQNIIHRDVKPANVKIVSDGQGPGYVALVDFGLAKLYDPAQETTIGARGVTPGYAPPEQYGRGRTDSRSDVYSVGATLYALLTSQAPPDGLDLTIDQAKLIPPRQLNPSVSTRTEAAILKAMHSRPADRFQTIAELRKALLGTEQPAPVTAETPQVVGSDRPAPKPAPPPALEPTALQPAGERKTADQEALPAALKPTAVMPAREGPTPAQKVPHEPASSAGPAHGREPARPPLEPGAPRGRQAETQSVALDPMRLPHAEGYAVQEPRRRRKPRRSRFGSATLPRWFWPALSLAVVLGVAIIVSIVVLLSNRGKPADQAANLTPIPGSAISTAGVTIFFTSDRDGKPEVYGLRNGQAVRFTFTPGRAGSWGSLAEPDGDVLFTSTRDGKREVYRLGREGPVRITNTPVRYESWAPFPAPDGDILFTSDRSGKREIYRLSREGTTQVTRTPGDAESWEPSVERDGDILFTSNRNGRREIYRLGPDGTVRVTNTSGGESWGPFPEPDGDILFTSDRDGDPEIYRFGADGIVQVTNTLRGESWAPYAGQNGFILFTSNRPGKRELFRLSSDGTVQLTNTPGEAESWWER